MHDGPANLLRSPLHALHVALGARFTEFSGWWMPLRYGSEIAEHRIVREQAGLFDLSHMGQLEVAGPEAASALDYALVGHLSAMQVGGARYTMLCEATGGVLDDLVAYRLASDRYLLVVNAVNTRTAYQALKDRCAHYAAAVTDRTNERAIIAVQGPRAAAVVEGLTDTAVNDLRYYTATTSTIHGRPTLVARTGYTGEDGFELLVDAKDASGIWTLALAAGRRHGLSPTGLACRDSLRIEAGMPLYGSEIDREATPFDAGLGRVVSFDKAGDFVGRAALMEVRKAGAARRLVGLVTAGQRVPRAGHQVVTLTDVGLGEPVGIVTSGIPSPVLKRPVAMASIQSSTDEKARFAVIIRGTAEPVQITPLPFYRRPR
ncbi:glycine cleavage system aminomethyltransferase GcvT [Micromonospora sp. WMMD1274]|uniref:glycine cleavage system aminomethyltransferase GcvT n=1 Tax=Micromonospora sp. WMMD1274 TaxID=3404116 RepID=UPI003B92CFF9